MYWERGFIGVPPRLGVPAEEERRKNGKFEQSQPLRMGSFDAEHAEPAQRTSSTRLSRLPAARGIVRRRGSGGERCCGFALARSTATQGRVSRVSQGPARGLHLLRASARTVGAKSQLS